MPGIPRRVVCTDEKDAVYRMDFSLTREQAEFVSVLRERQECMFGELAAKFTRRFPDADVRGPLDGEDLIWAAAKKLGRPIAGSWHGPLEVHERPTDPAPSNEDITLVESRTCQRCGSTLGAQNPHHICDTCRTRPNR